MSYTSEQYKYLLVKRLQRHFSMDSAQDRAYTQSFFWKLFDDSVTVTEEPYNNFCRLMDDEIELCAENGWYKASSIPSNVITEQGLLLTKAFVAIGVDCKTSADGYVDFKKPNGEAMRYSKTNFYINSRAGTVYQYAKESASAYNFQTGDVPQGTDNPKIAGPGTYWSYKADTKTMTISGNGAYAGATSDTQLGGGTYETVILGANVSRLLRRSLYASSEKTIIFFASADAPVVLDTDIFPWSSSDVRNLTIYADNLALRSYKWPDKVNITWHTLAEWGG